MGKLFKMDLYSKYGRDKLTLREKIFIWQQLFRSSIGKKKISSWLDLCFIV